jgi:hypothetical protein
VVSTESEAKEPESYSGEATGAGDWNPPNIFIPPPPPPPDRHHLPKMTDRNASISSDIFSIVDALDRSRIQENKQKPVNRQLASIGGHLISFGMRNTPKPAVSLFEPSYVEE